MNCLETPIVKFTDLKIDTPVVAEALGLTPPAPPGYDHWWDYFITVAFPTNQKFKIKHLELGAQGRSKIVFSDIKYGDCTAGEQYKYLLYCMDRHIDVICDRYEAFFEYTKSGNLHLHLRIGYISKKSTMKDIRCLFHRMFNCSTQYSKFIDIKKYVPDRWNDYSNKYKKQYQTTGLPVYTNVHNSSVLLDSPPMPDRTHIDYMLKDDCNLLIKEVEGESHESIRESE